MDISTIGLDLAKNVFQVHAVSAGGEKMLAKGLRRGNVLAFFSALPRCLIGIEACATAHYWGRELRALGHEVQLIPPAYVKAYVRRGKSDAIDAAAICEAVQRPGMRFVPIKTAEQQAALTLHRVRQQMIGQRTRLINVIRALMAEFGLTAPLGPENLAGLTAVIADENDTRLPPQARAALSELVGAFKDTEERLHAIDKAIKLAHKADAASRRLATQPGIGPIAASAARASVPDPHHFRSGRDFAASLGITPRQHSTGGKERLGRISKMGDRYLRTLLVLGATSVLAQAKRFARPEHAWILRLLQRRPPRVVIVAIANKMARVLWAMMVSGEAYRAPLAA
jgi:transposase